jgi:hypothetical protein
MEAVIQKGQQIYKSHPKLVKHVPCITAGKHEVYHLANRLALLHETPKENNTSSGTVYILTKEPAYFKAYICKCELNRNLQYRFTFIFFITCQGSKAMGI